MILILQINHSFYASAPFLAFNLYTNASIHAQFTSDCTDPSICLYVGQTINSDGTIYRSDDTEYEYKLRGKYY